MQKLLVLALVGLAFISQSSGARESSIVFLHRHAEKRATDKAEKDPALSPAGKRRADALAQMLRSAGVRRVFATEYKRTQETAAAIAAVTGAELVTVPAGEVAALVGKVRQAQGNSVVIGHSNTIPEIARALGVTAEIAIGEDEYDHLFIIALSERPTLAHLRLGSL